MAIAYTTSTSFAEGNGTSVATVSKPASTAVGDVLIAQLYIENNGEACTIASTGDTWTLVHDHVNTTTTPDTYQHVWICVVANTSSTIGVTWGGGSFWRDFAVHRFTGVDTTTPQDATATENTGSSTTPTSLSITTATDNAFLVACHASFDGFAQSGWTSPLVEGNDSGNISMASGAQAAAGASGNKTSTQTSGVWVAIMLALRPAAGAANKRRYTLTTLGVG